MLRLNGWACSGKREAKHALIKDKKTYIIVLYGSINLENEQALVCFFTNPLFYHLLLSQSQ